MAGWCNGSTKRSARLDIRSTRIPASIAAFLVVCLLTFNLSIIPSASAESSAFNARIWFSTSFNGTSGWVQYQAPLDNFVWSNARPYVRIDKITFPKNPNEDSTWTGGNLFFNVHVGGVCYIEGITGFTFTNEGGNTYKADSRGYTTNPSYTLDYYITGHNTTYPVAPSTPYYGDNFYYSRQTYVISGVVGMSANADITIEFTNPPILKFWVNGSVGEARPYFISDFDFIPTYYDWLSTLNHNVLVTNDILRQIVGSLSSLSDLSDTLDVINSNVDGILGIMEEHNTLTEKYMSQASDLIDTLDSGVQSGYDALGSFDFSGLPQFDESALDNVDDWKGWFSQSTLDMIDNVPKTRGVPDVPYVLDDWYDKFFSFWGGSNAD